jgi:hypothetical protein
VIKVSSYYNVVGCELNFTYPFPQRGPIPRGSRCVSVDDCQLGAVREVEGYVLNSPLS